MMRDVVVRWIVIFLLALAVTVIVRKVYRVIHAHAALIERDCDPRNDLCAEGCP